MDTIYSDNLTFMLVTHSNCSLYTSTDQCSSRPSYVQILFFTGLLLGVLWSGKNTICQGLAFVLDCGQHLDHTFLHMYFPNVKFLFNWFIWTRVLRVWIMNWVTGCQKRKAIHVDSNCYWWSSSPIYRGQVSL